MKTLADLFESFTKKELTFEQLLSATNNIEWAVLHNHGDEPWWSNENTSAVVDLYFHEHVITAEQRKQILSAA